MTLMLTDAEMAALDRLSESKDMTKAALIRQALRLYQALDERLSRGDKVFVEDEAKKEKAELVVL
jgi:predicted transcriptional regulator